MILEKQIEFYEKCAKICEFNPEVHGQALQLAGWLQELKERREKDSRKAESHVDAKREVIYLRKRLGHLLQSEFIRSFDAKAYKTGEYLRDIKDADKLVDKWTQYPSEDECPPEGIEVLVTLSSGDVVVDFYSGSDFLTYGPRVVAWMRFPEPWERWCN